MKIVCAQSVTGGREAFAGLGEVVVLPDRGMGKEELRDADALIVRSKTRVGRELLEGTGVKFVATATAGFDHLAHQSLDATGIAERLVHPRYVTLHDCRIVFFCRPPGNPARQS